MGLVVTLDGPSTKSHACAVSQSLHSRDAAAHAGARQARLSTGAL